MFVNEVCSQRKICVYLLMTIICSGLKGGKELQACCIVYTALLAMFCVNTLVQCAH